MNISLEQCALAGRFGPLSWSFDRPAFIGVVGANGAGKSSLLATIAGLVAPTEGQLWLDGRALSQHTRQQLRDSIAYLPQQPEVHAAVTVAQVLQYGLANLSEPQRARAALPQLMTTFALNALADRPLQQLSGGEQRRVHLARAVSGQQPLILLDEPTTGLDLGQQLLLLELIGQWVGAGRTVIAALHDLAHAAQYCDHLLLLEHGRLRASGRPHEVLSPEHLAAVFAVDATWLCDARGVALFARPLPR